MKKSNMLIVLVIIVIAIAAVVIWMQRDDANDAITSTSPPPTSAGETGEQVTVAYNGSIFEPSILSVSSGETVTFRNNSTTPVWPASDAHPTHNELPGFDARRGLGQGETYSFTFDQVGEWGYHNHLNASQTGTIIVE